MFIVGIVMQLLFLAALVGEGYLLYRAVTKDESDSDQASKELRLAYSRGDLTNEEYERAKPTLEQDT
jgi:putative membrane protein